MQLLRATLLLTVALLPPSAALGASFNVASTAEIRSRPYVGASTRFLVDGRVPQDADGTLMLSAPLPIRVGEMPVEYTFTFPEKVSVTKVRIFQYETVGRQPATAFSVEIDDGGDGKFRRAGVTRGAARGNSWTEFEPEQSKPARALRIKTVGFPSTQPNYGGSVLGEVEILSATPLEKPANRRSFGNELKIVKVRQLDWPSRTEDGEPEIRRGVFASLWMFWRHERAALGNQAYSIPDSLERLHVNQLWLYPRVSLPSSSSILTQPLSEDDRYFAERQLTRARSRGNQTISVLGYRSRVGLGIETDVLSGVTKLLAERNIRVVANESFVPYAESGWAYPRVATPESDPDVLSSRHVSRTAESLYEELAAENVQGVSLGGDELFIYGRTGSGESQSPFCSIHQAANDPCGPSTGQLFGRKYGLQIPSPDAPFSQNTAKWQQFKYEQLADLTKRIASTVKKTRPGIESSVLLQPSAEVRPNYGVAYDLLGYEGGIDVLTSDPYWSGNSYLGRMLFPIEAQRLLGASPSRRAEVTLQSTPHFTPEGYVRPIMVFGPALSALMQGVTGINFYRQDLLFRRSKNDPGPSIESTFKLVANLERNQILPRKLRKSVAVLVSRSSEDWWLLKHRDDSQLAARGVLQTNGILEVLLRHGIAIDLLYLDQPAALERLNAYEQVIVPFPDSVSDASVRLVLHAAKAGIPVTTYSRKGENNEFGVPRAVPSLVGSGIRNIDLDLESESYASLSRLVISNLRSATDLRFIASTEQDVECAMVRDDNPVAVACMNWGEAEAEVELTMNLPGGLYEARVFDLTTEYRGHIDDHSPIASTSLRAFRLRVPAGEPRFVSFTHSSSN